MIILCARGGNNFITTTITIPPSYRRRSAIMAALTQLSIPLDRSEYTSWDACRKAIKDWSILAKFSFATPMKNKVRATYACVIDKCPWKCYARRDKRGIIKLRIANGEHTCEGGAETKRKASSTKEFLDEAIPQFIRVSEKTTAKEIIDCIALQFGETISYQVALNCLQRLQHGGLGEQRFSFQLLPAYFDLLQRQDSDATVQLAIDPLTSELHHQVSLFSIIYY
jgi:hypothetical protein